MSYTKTVWTAGDTITAEKLNNIEDGIEAADKPTYSPETITGEGDVSIIYKGSQIGVLSNSGTLILETEDTICEDDIEVEYTKPAPAAVTIPVYYRTSSGVVLINNTPALPGTKMRFEIDNVAQTALDTSATGWTDDTMTNYTTDLGINAKFSNMVLTVDFYQPNEIPAGNTRYVINLER